MRKIEAFVRQLLDESLSLPQEKQEKAMNFIASKFSERVPSDALSMMAEQFAAAVSGDSAETSANSSLLKSALKEDQAPEASNEADDGAWVENGGGDGADAATEDGGDKHAEAVQQLLTQTAKLQPKDWPRVWSQHCSGLCTSQEDEAWMIASVLEAPTVDGAGEDHASRVIVELCRVKSVDLKSIEEALRSLAERLEDLVQVTPNAWQTHSTALMLMFPRTPSSTFGWQRPGWNWIAWWQLVERVLEAANPFRAFDILVLVLQMMQETGECLIKEMQVWKEPGRMQRVKKILAKWGEMEEAGAVDTLQAYDVQLA